MRRIERKLAFLSSVINLTAVPLLRVLLEYLKALETFKPVVAVEAAARPFSTVLPFAMLLPISRASKSLNTITGQYSYVGNPCTTEPCLPGMAYALSVNGKYYYLTVDDRCFTENRSWDGYTPEPGDLVTITGYLLDKRDISGEPFHTIEVVSLRAAE